MMMNRLGKKFTVAGMGQIALHAVTEASDRHFLPATFRGKKKKTLKSLPYLNIKSPLRFRSFFFKGVPFILVFPFAATVN